MRVKALVAAGVASGLVACAPVDSDPVETVETGEESLIARGEAMAGALCSTCHAVGPVGESHHPDAKPLRRLSWNYPIEALAEPLAEGIIVGHPDMPVWTFEPDEIDALLAYLESIQEPRDAVRLR